MCKFTNRLFVFALLLSAETTAIDKQSQKLSDNDSRSGLLDLLYDDYIDDYLGDEEIHYDQRQKGEENFRLRLNGFLFAVPSNEENDWGDVLDIAQLTDLLSDTQAGTLYKDQPKPVQSPVTIENKLEQENKLEKEEPPLLIKILSPSHKQPEARHRINFVANERAGNSRTKAHMLQLINKLSRTRKY